MLWLRGDRTPFGYLNFYRSAVGRRRTRNGRYFRDGASLVGDVAGTALCYIGVLNVKLRACNRRVRQDVVRFLTELAIRCKWILSTFGAE